MQKAPNPPCMRDLDLHNSLFSLLIGLSTSPLDVHFPIRAHKAGLARHPNSSGAQLHAKWDCVCDVGAPISAGGHSQEARFCAIISCGIILPLNQKPRIVRCRTRRGG